MNSSSPSSARPPIWVVIPAFNAANTLPRVVDGISEVFPEINIVVINDGSTDRTGESVDGKSHVYVLHHPFNRGVGAAIKSGIRFALTKQAEVMVTIGADNQRDIREIQNLIDPIRESTYDMSIGSRFLTIESKIPMMRRWGNVLMTRWLNLLFRSKFTDVTAGFRAVNRKVACDIDDLADRYSFDADLCIRALQKKYKTIDVPVKVFYTGAYTRMKSTFFTGSSIAWKIFKRRLTFRLSFGE